MISLIQINIQGYVNGSITFIFAVGNRCWFRWSNDSTCSSGIQRITDGPFLCGTGAFVGMHRRGPVTSGLAHQLLIQVALIQPRCCCGTKWMVSFISINPSFLAQLGDCGRDLVNTEWLARIPHATGRLVQRSQEWASLQLPDVGLCDRYCWYKRTMHLSGLVSFA